MFNDLFISVIEIDQFTIRRSIALIGFAMCLYKTPKLSDIYVRWILFFLGVFLTFTKMSFSFETIINSLVSSGISLFLCEYFLIIIGFNRSNLGRNKRSKW